MAIITDTIAAIATPPGRGGVGIIRLSGPDALRIGRAIAALDATKILPPRYALFTSFYDRQGLVLDEGLLLYFQAPHSFTGEQVVELQAHGGPITLGLLLQEAVNRGARMARPGEFSERAFLNDKLDLAQAEAIADLIEAGSEAAARAAVHTLQGAFSQCIDELLEDLIHLRLFIEAAIDFPEEEIDFLADGQLASKLNVVLAQVDTVLRQAQQGVIQSDGMRVVIAGLPNAGKSSLLNALAGHDAAIVTDVAGTTRDVLREHIQIDGMPLHIIDTAGLRESPDAIEQEGIRRAKREIDAADAVMWVWDSRDSQEGIAQAITQQFPQWPKSLFLVLNKSDLSHQSTGLNQLICGTKVIDSIGVSAVSCQGLDALRDYLKALVGYQPISTGHFSARQRHVDALLRAKAHCEQAKTVLIAHRAGELAAEDLRLAQNSLSEITGAFSADDLLGRIFSSFCIGK
ncbi:MAG: tRNA uridine-5-carboxymethylaminomethyl(34) synthesis GTPase MnmE [Paraglaciecola sp.]|nr:tRNA uridine-5-carboxymethylaminomethyl(34) synthesis GTPase MnmE [Paraglaciecola sp.]